MASDIDKAGKVKLYQYIKRFGSYSKAVKAVGLVPNKRGRVKQQKYYEYSDEYLLNHLKELAVKPGRAPYGPEIDKAGVVHSWVYYKRFGSLIKAQEAAGLVPTKKRERNKYTEEDVLNYLRELSVKLGRTPMMKDVNADGKLGIGVICKRFRQYSKAIEKAGLIPYKHSGYFKSRNKQSGE